MLSLLVASAILQPIDDRPLATAGDEYEISRLLETSETSSDNSSSDTHDQDVLLERVIAVRQDGLELEYDLPKDATAEDRARDWKFPARLFKPTSGTAQLLNRAELEARLEKWLKLANWDRKICGTWIFTWNAFFINCDPRSVIPIIETYDLRSVEMRDAVVDIDPEAIRKQRANSDVSVSQLLQKPITLEQAMAKHAKEVISGTISTKYQAGSDGQARRRVTVTKVKIVAPGGVITNQTSTETLERTLISRP